MNLQNTFDIYQSLRDDNLSFIYQGEFTDDVTDRILHLSEHNIKNTEKLHQLRHKVSFLMAECFQNIIRHGEKPVMINRITNKSGIFLTRNIGNAYYITSANLIDNHEVSTLEGKLQKINELDKDALKKLYLDILSNASMSGKGGAGLGLIEMARKSGQKLQFDFQAINDKLSLFYLQINVSAKGEPPQPIDLDTTKSLHSLMIRHNILMTYKGDFSQNTVMPVLRMIEQNMMNQLEEFIIKKKVYLMLVEILQNISRHGKNLNGITDGIFMMGKKDHYYQISAGNLVDATQQKVLEEKINSLNELDKEGLKDIYKKTLKDGVISDKGGAGLGLIDIARDSSDKIEFGFYPIDDNTSFFAICVKI